MLTWIRRIGGGLRLSVAPLFRRFCSLLRLGWSHLSPRRNLTWICCQYLMEWAPQARIDLEFGSVLMLVDHLVPLSEGIIVKNEVILSVESSLMWGWRVCAGNLRASCIYKVKHLWSTYLKKSVRVWDPLKQVMEPSSDLIVKRATENKVHLGLHLL